MIVLGSGVAAFERAFAGYCGAKHAVAINSGTSALHVALLAAGVRPGDEVITVPMTFVATVAGICYVNATPVFIDIDEEGLDYGSGSPSACDVTVGGPNSARSINSRVFERVNEGID